MSPRPDSGNEIVPKMSDAALLTATTVLAGLVATGVGAAMPPTADASTLTGPRETISAASTAEGLNVKLASGVSIDVDPLIAGRGGFDLRNANVIPNSVAMYQAGSGSPLLVPHSQAPSTGGLNSSVSVGFEAPGVLSPGGWSAYMVFDTAGPDGRPETHGLRLDFSGEGKPKGAFAMSAKSIAGLTGTAPSATQDKHDLAR